ncbi:MAG: DNA-processing protein DprA [Candidatus Eisenbacteria bacterium]
MGAPKPSTLEELILVALAHAPAAAGAPGALARSLARLGVDALAREDAGYPAGWRDLPDAPPVVFRRGGDLPAVAEAVAIVGSRAASDYGLRMARRLAADLATAGQVVVSGLARGIDAAAHEGALSAGGRTVAVVPSGLDAITPVHHHPLAARIAERGALVSELASGPPRFRGVFVARNRLIAAMAGTTVVVEASHRGGALHTARAARRLGRRVLAVPGDADRDTAMGCIELLREGAEPCVSAADVLAWSGPARAPRPSPPPRRAGGPTRAETPGTPAQRVRAALEEVARPVDAIARHAGLTVSETLAHLLALEWAGLALRVPGGRWRGGRA